MVMQRGLVTELLLCKICADAEKPAKSRLQAESLPHHLTENLQMEYFAALPMECLTEDLSVEDMRLRNMGQ
jgi:hypothetical protein